MECLRDVTSSVEIKASSRQAMVGSLVDGSTETFWESGDEDRNKTKSLVLACSSHHFPRMVCLHIDNCRDLAVSVHYVFMMLLNVILMYLIIRLKYFWYLSKCCTKG